MLSSSWRGWRRSCHFSLPAFLPHAFPPAASLLEVSALEFLQVEQNVCGHHLFYCKANQLS